MADSAMNLLTDRFAHPWVLWLLLTLPALAAGGLWVRRRRQRALATWLGESRSAAGVIAKQWLAVACWFTATAFVIIGCAGPQWGRDPASPPALGRDIWIALDVSRSMLAEDPVCRLDRAKRFLRELAETVQRRGDYRLGLIAFAGNAKVLCPLTEDYDHFRFALEMAHPDRLHAATRLGHHEDGSSFGTSLQAALSLAAGLHDDQLRGYEHLILVTDGDDLAGGWQAGADQLVRTGIAVHVLGIGNRDKENWIPSGRADEPYLLFESQRVTTRRHDELLTKLANVAHGDYQPEEKAAHPLVQWFEHAVTPLPLREWSEDRQPLLVQRFGWFFGAALAFFVIGLTRSDRPLPAEERM